MKATEAQHLFNHNGVIIIADLTLGHFVFSLRSVSVHFRPDYMKFPHQYLGKLNDSISESHYYTSSDS